MKTKLSQLATLVFLLAILNSHHSSAHAQGVLMPPGAPAPTMKTLDQIEARTPISSAPFSISTPGSYYLTTNLTVFTANAAIVIGANNVTLDLNGFTIISTQNPATTGKGIALGNSSGPVANVTIRNGFITGGVTNNGTTFGGSGFGYGIFQFGGQPSVNVHVSDVTVSGCLYVGIHLGSSNSVVESCTVNSAGSYGIYAQSISDSTAMNCGSYGIYATGSANNCSGSGIINGSGLSAFTAQNCIGTGSGGYGILATSAANCIGVSSNNYGIYATSVENCYGVSTSRYGLYVTSANNSYGYSSSSYGIYSSSAQNCSGFSTSSYGLFADCAMNCGGYSSSYYGLYVTSIAQNCIGESSGGTGLYSQGAAIGCFGSSSSGTGLYAFIANVCGGNSTTGTALSATHNVNSF